MSIKTPQEIIKLFMSSLDTTTYSGKKALDQAVKYASGGYFSDVTTLINKIVADCKNLGADKFLRDMCGIILDNNDTGAITGSDAGGAKVKTAESIVPESGKRDTSFKANSFTTNGLTFTLSKTSLTKDETYIWQSLKTWWAKEALNLIKESYGYSFTDSDATCKDILVTFKDDTKNSYLAYVEEPKKISGRYSMTLNINKAFFNNFSSSDVNGKSTKFSTYLDRTLAHELTHAVMIAKVNGYAKLPTFIKEGLAELTHGADDKRTANIKNLAKNSATLKSYLNVNSQSSLVNVYAAGYIFLRYFAKQVADDDSTIKIYDSDLTVPKNFSGDSVNPPSAVINVDASALTKDISIYGNSNSNSIAGGSANDRIWGNDGDDTIDAGAGNDAISGGNGADSINGGDGNDTISGGKGNDILIGGAGNDKVSGNEDADKIWGNDGNDTLDGGAGNDAISGGDGADSINGGDGNDNISGGKGNDILIGGAGNDKVSGNEDADKIWGNDGDDTIDAGSGNDAISGGDGADSINGGDGNDTISGGAGNDILIGGAGNDKVSGNEDADKIWGNDGNDTLDGGAGNDAISGGNGADSIHGGAGNDYISGGNGNDTLWGDAGADTFVYASGDGQDIIYGFENNDMLKITGAFAATYNSNKKELYFDIGTTANAITLKEFTATSFNINGTAYKISGSSFVKK